MNQVNGQISKFLYRNERNYYSTFLLNLGKELITVVGHFPLAYLSSKMNIYGTWKAHKKYGKQFQATSYEILTPSSPLDLMEFLQSDMIKCSWQMTSRIKEKMGLSYLDHYQNVPFCISKMGLTSDHVPELTKISRKLASFYLKKELLQKMVGMGFKQEVACKIAFSEIPPTVQEVVDNPYRLIKAFELDWKTVDSIALSNGMSKDSKVRIQEGIFYLVDDAAVQKGHMFLPLEELREMATYFLNTNMVVEEHLKELETAGRVTMDAKRNVYSLENYNSERLLADNLYRIFYATPAIPATTVDFSKTKFPFSEDQKEAIQMAIEQQIALISGPAGTGKTTVIREIIDRLKRLGHTIKLCAPTGAAAKQMFDLTGMHSRTIQSLLAFSPVTKTPIFNQSEPLEGTCFFVDESSMVDVKIMSFLADAIPSGAKLVIIGDAHQLPSVGPGRMLKDLLTCGFFPGKELSTVYRQSGDSKILEIATQIRKGEPIDLSLLPAKSDFKFYIQNDPYIIRKNLEQLVTRFMNNGKYNVFEDLQIVTPIHAGPLGTKELNSMLQNLINPSGNEISVGDKTFREGDKVVQTRNNYDKKIFNGETGRIESISKRGKHMIVNFNGDFIEYVDDELFELELAYAQTVHRVQGREIPFVIAPFHSCFGAFMLHRKLLYTLMTRAKQQLIMLGQTEAFYQAALKDDIDVRHCNLIGRLKSARLVHVFK